MGGRKTLAHRDIMYTMSNLVAVKNHLHHAWSDGQLGNLGRCRVHLVKFGRSLSGFILRLELGSSRRGRLFFRLSDSDGRRCM